MSIVVIDYGVGNVKSIKNSFKVNGENVVLSNKKDDILKSKGIVLPGVGAFSKAMENLHNHNLYNVIKIFD